MTIETALKWVQMCSYFAAVPAAVWAVWVYQGNSRRERAKWAENLYSRFFEKKELKDVRDLLDCARDDPKVYELVAKEGSEWTDYLNFFEFVAYLQSSKQLSSRDVQALFGYYIECLRKHAAVLEYVQKEEKGFDYLRRLLLDA